MQSFSAGYPANPPRSDHIRTALTNFADEVCATLARLFAYVGVLALFGILGLHGWDRLRVELAAEPAPDAGWSIADRSYPAFALSPQPSPQGTPDKFNKSDTYVILRHPSGGRKDILRWSDGTAKPVAELEIYRPGSEYGPATAAYGAFAARMLAPGTEAEAAGVIESKFGSIALVRQAGAGGSADSCLGFFKRIDDPAVQISGWSCEGDGLPARRAAVACMLNRLMLLTAGHEPKLAELFARAELRRGNCAGISSAGWMTDVENPRLRGTL